MPCIIKYEFIRQLRVGGNDGFHGSGDREEGKLPEKNGRRTFRPGHQHEDRLEREKGQIVLHGNNTSLHHRTALVRCGGCERHYSPYLREARLDSQGGGQKRHHHIVEAKT